MWAPMIYATARYRVPYADISSVCVSLREMINEWQRLGEKHLTSSFCQNFQDENGEKDAAESFAQRTFALRSQCPWFRPVFRITLALACQARVHRTLLNRREGQAQTLLAG